jgi:hypothetical protein
LPLGIEVIMRYASRLVCAGFLSTSFCVSAFGQAIVLDKGQATFGLSYQHTFVRYHVGFDGTKVDLGHIMSYAIRPEISYGLTDRITMDGDVAFSGLKYIGTQPHGRLDDGTFHETFQDAHLGLRWNWLMRPLLVTPFMQITVPTHHYQLEGHTATGKGRGEFTSGVYAGRELTPLIPNAYFEAMVSHSIVQRTTIEVASERLNRTNGSIEIGYFLTPSVTLRAFGNGVRTHGGWDLPRNFGPGEFAEHDRFDKTKDIQAGGAVSYTFRNGLGVYTGYFWTVWARTAHQLAGPTFGVTWAPGPRQSWLAHMRRPPVIQVAEASPPVR